MNSSSWIVFKGLLERGGPTLQSSVSRYLSKEEMEKLDRVKAPKEDPFLSTSSLEDRLERVHYSWLIPFLEPFAEKDKRLILSALNPLQAQKLKAHFKVKEVAPSIQGIARSFITSAVYEWLISDQKEFLPLEFLPHNPLNALYALSKSELH